MCIRWVHRSVDRCCCCCCGCCGCCVLCNVYTPRARSYEKKCERLLTRYSMLCACVHVECELRVPVSVSRSLSYRSLYMSLGTVCGGAANEFIETHFFPLFFYSLYFICVPRVSLQLRLALLFLLLLFLLLLLHVNYVSSLLYFLSYAEFAETIIGAFRWWIVDKNQIHWQTDAHTHSYIKIRNGRIGWSNFAGAHTFSYTFFLLSHLSSSQFTFALCVLFIHLFALEVVIVRGAHRSFIFASTRFSVGADCAAVHRHASGFRWTYTRTVQSIERINLPFAMSSSKCAIILLGNDFSPFQFAASTMKIHLIWILCSYSVTLCRLMYYIWFQSSTCRIRNIHERNQRLAFISLSNRYAGERRWDGAMDDADKKKMCSTRHKNQIIWTALALNTYTCRHTHRQAREQAPIDGAPASNFISLLCRRRHRCLCLFRSIWIFGFGFFTLRVHIIFFYGELKFDTAWLRGGNIKFDIRPTDYGLTMQFFFLFSFTICSLHSENAVQKKQCFRLIFPRAHKLQN